MVYFNVSFADDVVVAAIPILQMSMFMLTDTTKFCFIRLILEVMLAKVP